MIVVILATFCLAATIFAVIPTRNGNTTNGTYDAWIDYNEDGVIDGADFYGLLQTWGTLGDPTKNVNVTNWPLQQETFPKNLLLRGTRQHGTAYNPVTYYEYRSLIDEDTPYANIPDRYDYDGVAKTYNTTNQVIYKQNFIYEKIPTKSYQILGMPTVSLTFNVTTTPPLADFYISVYVRLGVISTSHVWQELVDLGTKGDKYSGYYYHATQHAWFNAYVTSPIVINATQRLAVQIEIRAWTYTETQYVFFELLFGINTDEFLVSIPIAESP